MKEKKGAPKFNMIFFFLNVYKFSASESKAHLILALASLLKRYIEVDQDP
jgi:hypothetical protein